MVFLLKKNWPSPRWRQGGTAHRLGCTIRKGACNMNDIQLNGPSRGCAISAEEFAASLAVSGGAGTGCACRQDCAGGQNCADQGCPCGGEQMICCCRAIPKPAPVPEVQEGCCCKQSFRAALQLLCDSQIASLVNFDAAVFLTDTYSAGSTLSTTVPETTPADNLVTPSGSFLRLSSCNCDLLDISAALYTPPATSTGVTATQVSLCELAAIALQVAQGTAEGDVTAPEATTRNYRRLKQLLSQRLNPCNSRCGECSCKCNCDDCCCTAGILSLLSDNNLSRKVTLAAGQLVLQGVTLLGTLGNVLVLANDEDQRIYFVCAAKVQFLG